MSLTEPPGPGGSGPTGWSLVGCRSRCAHGPMLSLSGGTALGGHLRMGLGRGLCRSAGLAVSPCESEGVWTKTSAGEAVQSRAGRQPQDF